MKPCLMHNDPMIVCGSNPGRSRNEDLLRADGVRLRRCCTFSKAETASPEAWREANAAFDAMGRPTKDYDQTLLELYEEAYLRLTGEHFEGWPL